MQQQKSGNLSLGWPQDIISLTPQLKDEISAQQTMKHLLVVTHTLAVSVEF
jgi:hypothetical protein